MQIEGQGLLILLLMVHIVINYNRTCVHVGAPWYGGTLL